jgi:hypothetical protein
MRLEKLQGVRPGIFSDTLHGFRSHFFKLGCHAHGSQFGIICKGIDFSAAHKESEEIIKIPSPIVKTSQKTSQFKI